ncbi:MAG: hypothetical protein V1799_15730 [bacterium]
MSTRSTLSKVNLGSLSDDQLVLLRANLDKEMRRRGIAFSVGEVGEKLVINHFRNTPGLPKLQAAPKGTKNVDALSRGGDRYSIKTVCNARKTGTIYPDPADKNKQLFEELLIVRLNEDWTLQSIHQFSWQQFLKIRSWDKRMNAWYVSCSGKTLSKATQVFPLSETILSKTKRPAH